MLQRFNKLSLGLLFTLINIFLWPLEACVQGCGEHGASLPCYVLPLPLCYYHCATSTTPVDSTPVGLLHGLGTRARLPNGVAEAGAETAETTSAGVAPARRMTDKRLPLRERPTLTA